MTIFEDVLRDLLISTNLTGTRVFLIRAPQKPAPQTQTPYMIFLNVGPLPIHSHDGPIDFIMREYQVSIFHESQSLALGIADALRGKLDGYRGDYEGVRFAAILYRTQSSAWEPDTEIHHIVTSFQIYYRVTGTLAATHNPRQHQRQQLRK
jgi:hypothetical protein